MVVYKFGGASLKNSSAIQNVASIIKQAGDIPLLVVVSAMGKITNELEQVVEVAQRGADYLPPLTAVKDYHKNIIEELTINDVELNKSIDNLFDQYAKTLNTGGDSDWIYDQIVSQGEILSSTILNKYLRNNGIDCEWIDACKYIHTNETYREGIVDWEKTSRSIGTLEEKLQHKIIITQGFIGGTQNQTITTLGREGSDYSAAIFATCLKAKSVTIWKDVPGVMSSDPKKLSTSVVFDELPFQEAAEMTYYGASVIHPKTIKPLANANIPLFVKNFDDPTLPGTNIHDCKIKNLPPLIVFKENQCLISCKVTDYSFINEHQMSSIFAALSETNTRINVMQNSAISFSFCADFQDSKILKLISMLSKNFEVFYNTGLTLVTVKNYDAKTFNEYRTKPGVLLEQSSRSTLQVLIKN